MHPGLRRLRWMFLGFLPDFVPATAPGGENATLEVLNPTAIGKPEVAAIADRIWDAFLPKKEIDPLSIGASARYIVRTAEKKATAETRLAILQQEANIYSLSVLEEIGS